MTLFETLVAVAILGLISALAFPALGRSVDALALDGAATALATELTSARATALRSGRGVRFDIATDARGYGWRAVGGGARRVALPPRVTIAMQPAAIGFYPDGSSTGARLALDAGRGRRTIAVDAATGLIAR